MAVEHIEVKGVVPATPQEVWDAWVDGKRHGEMTGGPATSEPVVGGACTAWDGYIQGRYLELEPGRRIVQTWRTTDFPEGAEDSRLEVILEAVGRGTRVTFRHQDLPEGRGEDFAQGWEQYYLEPMRSYFGGLGD